MKLAILGVASALCAAILVPLLFVVMFAGGGGGGAANCGGGPAVLTADGSPTILGPASLSAGQITAWWTAAYGATTPGGIPVASLVGWYLQHGATLGVRGDYAIAQGIVETSYAGKPFGSPHAIAQNNFAGIGVYSDSAHGYSWASPELGVIAHLEHLHKVAAGDNAPLAEPDIAPNWGGKTGITTWAGLAGNWATNSQYWVAISGWYIKMAGTATLVAANPAPATTTAAPAPGGSTTTTVPGAAGCAGGGGGSGPTCGATGTSAPTTAAAPTSTSTGTGVPADRLAPLWAFLCAQMGKPYVFGAAGPDSWDCSGLTMVAYAQVGVKLPHNAAAQYQQTGATMTPIAQLQPGDLVFFEAGIGHVGVYVGGGQMIDAPHTGASVERVALWASQYQGSSRPSK